MSEVVEQLGCSEDTVRDLVRRGALVAYRYNGPTGARYISQESIDSFLESVREPVAEVTS